MRVYIGPYRNNWVASRIHYRYMNRKYKFNWPSEDSQTPFENYLEKVEDFLQKIYNNSINKILPKLKRKIKVHIHPYDVWNMDNTLAHVVLPMLKMVRDNKHGSPSVDDSDVPDHLKSTSAPPKENEWDTDDNHHLRWQYVLDEMIYAFECVIDDDWEEQFHSGQSDIRWEQKTGSDGQEFSELVIGTNDTHEFNDKAHKKAWDRRNRGMILFGKYYHSLWT